MAPRRSMSLPIALILAAACGGTSHPAGSTPRESCTARASAFAAAIGALAASDGVEAPRGIVAAFDRDGVCPAGGVEQRVRCHLARPTVHVASRCTAGGWLFIISMPELSDHVHRARVWRRRGGALVVHIDSEN